MSFSTHTEMRSAGYIPAKSLRGSYRGFAIRAQDVSGPNAYGYEFAAVLVPMHRLDQAAFNFSADHPLRQHLGRAESVWLRDDLNAMHQPGCFVMAFSPAVVDEIMETAMALIDAHRESTVSDDMIAAADAEDREAAERLATEQRAEQALRDSRILSAAPGDIDTLPTMDRPMVGNQYMPLQSYGWRCAREGKTAALERHRRNPEFVAGFISGRAGQ